MRQIFKPDTLKSLTAANIPRAVGVKGDRAGGELNTVSHFVSIKKVINVGFLTPVPPLPRWLTVRNS